MYAVQDNSGFIVVYFQGHTCGAVIFSVPDMSGFIFRFAVFLYGKMQLVKYNRDHL